MRVWDVTSGRQKVELRGHSYVVDRVAWSPDGKFLASGGGDGVRFWDVDAAATVEPPLPGAVRKSFFAQDGKWLAAKPSAADVVLYEYPALKIAGGPRDAGLPVRYLTERNELVTLQQRRGMTAQLLHWSLPDLNLVGTTDVPEVREPLVLPVLSANGRWFAAGIGPSLIGFWDLQNGKLAARFGGSTPGVGRLRSLLQSPDARYLAGTFHDWPVILIWDFAKGTPTRAVTARHRGQIAQMVFSADGRLIVSCDTDKYIKIWDVATAQEQATLLGHRQGVTSVDISPDGRTVVSSSSDRTVRLWNVATHREIARFEGLDLVDQVSFGPDGNVLFLTTHPTAERPSTTLVWRAPLLAETDRRLP